MDNLQIASTFEEIGQLLEIDGANHFRTLAYKNAAENIRGMGRELSSLSDQELSEIPGIGADLHSKIVEMLTTNKCDFHVQLIKKFGRGVLEMLQIRGVGPKKVALFYKELGIDNLEKLKAAALEKKLSKLPRMGEKSENEILVAIEERLKYSRRMLLSEAEPLAEQILEFLKPLKSISQLSYAGSLRRRKETVGDLDILVSPNNIDDAPEIISHFQKFPLIKNIIANGPTKSAVILENGVQADLRVVEKRSFGAALHYFTGSKDHNVEIRALAQKANRKINEYGLWQIEKNQSETFIIGDTEKNLYQAVGLEFIPPTLRENRGEFEASINNYLPELIEINDLKGDLNINSNFGDGELSIEAIIKLYGKYDYIAINDNYHSQEVPSSFTSTKLAEQIDQISKIKAKTKIFQSLKIPINKDGTLDLPEKSLLEKIDFITVKINHDFNLPEPRQTARIISALNAHPKVKMLSVPTNRILNEREPLALNMEKVIEHCSKNNQIIEINANPKRLDLPDHLIKLAISYQTKLSINSDLIKANDLLNLKYGIWTAQRGWASMKNIINTQPLSKFKF
jgi:DNA polymerase (family 10)